MYRRLAETLLCHVLVALLCVAASSAHGQKGDTAGSSNATQQEIVIRAQTARLDQQSGIGIYEGRAELRQGKRHLTADRIRIELLNGEPARIEATGSPARLREGDVLDAHGESMVYDVRDEQVHISGAARVKHQGRVFEGAELDYDMATGQVDARGGDRGGRIRMVIPAEETEKR